ncbi:HEAT repeat domain-containing protein [Streptomyces sp. ID05-39B]|uniref:HEAT repeat domain-containing protein n=1 Tax=Streptomyces sp. ID05-39B TaxID=3028664 RepID=UPI0029BC524D|nr:HEAT repeat domain-containing protein [Streptomyces sp. ID05-39B]MDX3525418.1 HEAT repeat domain-containing protein [Streptomyces sp. ID05-39B]
MGASSNVTDGEAGLISAVRAGDPALVRRLLQADCDPAVRDAAFGLAVRTYAGDIAQLLLQYGADAGQCGPDELLPLRDAVESGSPALVEALLDQRIRGRYPQTELLEMLDLARRRHEAGAAAELRRRTGAEEALVHTRVQDDEYYRVGELTLGGRSVRDGHAAILTDLEELLGIRASFGELMARALHHDQDHPAWGRATISLAHRRDREIWEAAAALRTHPGPSHRLFGAEVLRLTHLFDDSDADAYAGPALDIFADWSRTETDLVVLTEVLNALGEQADSRAQEALLACAGHPDGGVRRMVAAGLGGWRELPDLSDRVREALLMLMTDVDTAVRRDACLTVGQGSDRAPVLAEAMAALLGDADRQVQVAAVHGLALHDDERCVKAARRLGPPQPGAFSEEHYLDAVWRYEWRRDGR